MRPLRHLPVLLLFTLLTFFFHRTQWSSLPSSTHAWAQMDRYALAHGFINNGFDLFHPQTYVLNKQFPGEWKSAYPTTVTAVDLPLNEYLVALLMKATGNSSPLIFRLYNGAMSVIALFFIYLLAELFTGSLLFAFLFSFTVGFSPLFAFYQSGLLPSIPSLSFCAVGIYFYFRFTISENSSERNWGFLFLTLAALTRTTYIVPLLAILTGHFFSSKKRSATILGSVITLLPILLYKMYNMRIAEQNGSMFLDHLEWPSGMSEAGDIISGMFKTWRYIYFSIVQHGIIALSWIGLLILLMKNRSSLRGEPNTKALLIGGVWLTGGLIFFVAMMEQFTDHDYYFLDAFHLLFILFTLLGFSWWIRRKKELLLVFTFLLGLSLYPVYVKAKSAYNDRLKTREYERTLPSINNFKSAIKLLGEQRVDKDARLLVFSPTAPNLPFVLLGRSGYAIMLCNEDIIHTSLSWPYDYILYQNDYFINDVLTHYPEIGKHIHPIATNGKVTLAVKNTSGKETLLADLIALGKDRSVKVVNGFKNDPLTGWDGLYGENGIYIISTKQEFGPLFRDTLKENIDSLRFIAEAKFLKGTDLENDASLVFSIDSAGKNLYYSGYDLQEFLRKKDAPNFVCVMYVPPRSIHKGSVLSWYVWNKGRDSLVCSDLRVTMGFAQRGRGAEGAESVLLR